MDIIIGAAVSLVVQLVKKYAGTSALGTYTAVFLLSIFAAAAYVYLVQTAYWDTLLTILTASGAFYAFIISRFENK